MKKQGASKSDDKEPKPSTSKPSEETEAAGAASTIDFGDASQYVELSPIGTGESNIRTESKILSGNI